MFAASVYNWVFIPFGVGFVASAAFALPVFALLAIRGSAVSAASEIRM